MCNSRRMVREVDVSREALDGVDHLLLEESSGGVLTLIGLHDEGNDKLQGLLDVRIEREESVKDLHL